MPALTTLAQIYIKVRRLVRAPSVQQLSDADLNNYINTFVFYDLPESLRLFNLRKTFTFYTTPYVDTYPLGTVAETSLDNQFYNFKNKYISIHEPLYIAGYRKVYTQSREQLYGIYPQVQTISAINAIGNGVTTSFAGFLPSNTGYLPTNVAAPTTVTLRNSVLFNSIDSSNNGIAMHDVPLLAGSHGAPVVNNFPGFGELVAVNTPPTGVFDPNNYVNYVTGQYVVTFPVAPAATQQIFSQCVPTVVSIPQLMLNFDDTLTLRPVPDKVYTVNFEVYVQPTEMLLDTQEPELQQWSQYLAYGAARKIFQDRMDMDSLAMIEPEFKAQERFVLRRTIVQLANQRTPTIYSESNGWPSGWFSNSGGQ